jgi:ABC-type nitrate/sulfonate/bicarbonate transport system substrate-binding protein
MKDEINSSIWGFRFPLSYFILFRSWAFFNGLFIASALLCVGFIAAAHAAELITLRYGQNAASAGSLSSLPLAVAERKGFFMREGIHLVVVPIPGGTDRIVAALDKGEIDTGRNATPYLIQAVLKGSDAVAILSQTANPVYSLIVRPEIKSFADLKEKVVGLSTPGDTITLSTLRLLALKGIKTSDFQAKAVVGTGARFECLKAGECVAVPMGQPEDLGAIKQGYPRLGYTYEAGADLVFNVDMTRRAWGEKNKDTLVRFVRAFAASYEFINDPKNRGEVTNIVMESLKVSEEVARQIFAPYMEPDKNVLPKRGELSLKAFNQVLALMSEAGVVPTPVPAAERFIDLRYLQAARIQ